MSREGKKPKKNRLSPKDKRVVSRIMGFFFRENKYGFNNFSNYVPTKKFDKMMGNLYTSCPVYWNDLLRQADDHGPRTFIRHVGAVFDIMSASKNKHTSLVLSTFKFQEEKAGDDDEDFIFDSWSARKPVYKFTYNNKEEYRIMIARDTPSKKHWRSPGYDCEMVQTPGGDFLYLDDPLEYKLPGHAVKVLVSNGLLYPVLTFDSSRMKLDLVWEKFYLRYAKTYNQLDSHTQWVFELAQREAIRAMGCSRRNFPTYGKQTQKAMCHLAWFSMGEYWRRNHSRFVYLLQQELMMDATRRLLAESKKAEEAKAARLIELAEASIKIQALFRGHHMRKRVREMHRMNKLAPSCIKIQALFRGWRVRLRINLLFTCPICYQKRLTEPITTHCGHQYHRDCLFKWTHRNPSCPSCRSVLP